MSAVSRVLVISCVGLAVACSARDEAVATTQLAFNALPCGTPLNDVDGVFSYSNGANEGTGDSCIPTPTPIGSYQYQCVEFAQRYMNTIYGITPLWPVGAAKEMCWMNPAGTTSHPIGDGYRPKHGDLAVWTGGTWGHVAVVKSVEGGSATIVEQNGASSPNGTRSVALESVGCWVTANANDGSATVLPSPSTPDPGPTTSTGRCALGDGLYCGGNGGGSDADALYRCAGGKASVVETCALGCEWMPDGKNDRCRADARCPLGEGMYCGGNPISGDPAVLFRCGGGKIVAVEKCAAGCRPMPPQQNDVCF